MCFSITGEFVTRHARNLWAELEVGKALRLLTTGIHGMDEGTALGICTGRLQLVGDTRDRPELELKPDDAEQDDRGLDLMSLEAIGSELRRRQEESAQREYELIQRVLGDPLTPGQMMELEAQEDFDARVEETLQAERWERMKENAERTVKALIPDHELNSQCGWVDSDGRYFACQYGQHIWLANCFGLTERQAEERGWIKISTHYIMVGKKKPTAWQLDTVLTFCQKHGRQKPYWFDDPDMLEE